MHGAGMGRGTSLPLHVLRDSGPQVTEECVGIVITVHVLLHNSVG